MGKKLRPWKRPSKYGRLKVQRNMEAQQCTAKDWFTRLTLCDPAHTLQPLEPQPKTG